MIPESSGRAGSSIGFKLYFIEGELYEYWFYTLSSIGFKLYFKLYRRENSSFSKIAKDAYFYMRKST